MENQTYSQLIEINIAELLLDLGLDNLSDDDKQKIADLVHANILAKIRLYLESLVETDEENEKLNTATEHTDLLIEYFVVKKGVDFGILLVDVIDEVRTELVQDISYIQGVMDATNNPE